MHKYVFTSFNPNLRLTLQCRQLLNASSVLLWRDSTHRVEGRYHGAAVICAACVMRARTLTVWWLLAGIAALAKAQSACPVDVSSLLVSSPEGALELAEALNCSGPGQFEVDWRGEVLVSSTIDVPDGVSLTVTGSPLGTDFAIINGSGDPGVQIFTVGDGAELELNGVSLVDGFGFGAAVFASEGSRLVARNCTFVGNTNCERENEFVP